MTNDITNHSAGLQLSEDFVNRAMAMRGGQNLDAAFLMDLLEAGLAIMELSAGNHDERCNNPDCAGCRIRSGEQPSPTIKAEFAELLEQLHRSAERAEAGTASGREMTIMVSETSLTFMAWLDRLIEGRMQGGLRIVGPDIDIDRPADAQRAGRYLSQLLMANMEQELASFVEGRNPLLFPPRRGKPH